MCRTGEELAHRCALSPFVTNQARCAGQQVALESRTLLTPKSKRRRQRSIPAVHTRGKRDRFRPQQGAWTNASRRDGPSICTSSLLPLANVAARYALVTASVNALREGSAIVMMSKDAPVSCKRKQFSKTTIPRCGPALANHVGRLHRSEERDDGWRVTTMRSSANGKGSCAR